VKEHLLLKDALHQYTKDSSKINGALRSSANTGIAPSPDMQQWIDDATYGLDTGLYALGPILGLKLPLHKDEDGLLYRGLTNAPLMRSLYNNYEVGTVIQDAAFFSTTRTKSVVDKSFSSADDPDDNILYKITHSFSGRFVNGISHFKGEDEVLFQPGTRFYVYKSEGNTVWMHEMHDDEELNITVREAIAERDFDEEDEEEEEVVDSDNEEDVDDDDEDGHHEVDSDDDNHEHKQNDVNDDESFTDTFDVFPPLPFVDDDFDDFDFLATEETPYFSTVAPGGEDHDCFVAEHQLEWYPDWYAQVYPEWYYSIVATDVEGCGCEHQLEWYPDWYAQVYPEWYYSTFATNMEGCDCVDVEVDVEPSPLQLECSGSVWKDGRRRSARLLAKKGGSKDEHLLLGSTVDHLGRRRSLRLQQKKR
jgi:hypothetical protein